MTLSICQRLQILGRKKHNIDRITWPSNSPDLNPIENVWNVMKQKVDQLHPSNLNQLEKDIKLVWSDLAQDLARNLVSSMSQRIAQVIERKGDSIDY